MLYGFRLTFSHGKSHFFDGILQKQHATDYEKCKPLDVKKHQSINTETSFHWGQKYESVSVSHFVYKKY